MKQIGFIEVWFGKIPDYFQYHVETIGSITCADFYFFTNDLDYDFSKIKNPNFHLNYITENEFIDKFNNISKIKVEKILYPKKIVDYKLFYFDMFNDLIKNYEYVGIYDIDTLFGNINNQLKDCLNEYDFISVGDEVYHNRLSGPLLILRNNSIIRELLRDDKHFEIVNREDIYGYGEQNLSEIAMRRFKTKIIYSMNTEINNGGKITFDVSWSGNRLYVNGEEKMLYHFYRKSQTIFQKVGNKIYGRFDKKFINDFYWVFGFTENYSNNIFYLLESLHNYSNRKCVIYCINFDYNLPDKFLTSEQFVLRRINIDEGKKDFKNRDENIISCKPKLMIDVIENYPYNKFIFIDTDVYLTVSADDLSNYFEQLENYPLINSHTHDRLYLSNIVEGEEWTSTIDILAKKTQVGICVFPRRKTNVILFDNKSKWFFEEQIELYEKFKDTEQGIFSLHDEDSANLILSKYGFYKSLHLCDIEETDDIDMSKFTDLNHPFHATGLSPYLKLPKHENDIFVFHGLKEKFRFEGIQKKYGNKVLDCEEILVYLKDNTVFFEKNSFLDTKKIDEPVDFIIKNLKNEIIEKLCFQNLQQYWIFYISNVSLLDPVYQIDILKSNSKQKIYNNLLCTTQPM